MFRKLQNSILSRLLCYFLIIVLINCQVGCRTYHVIQIDISDANSVNDRVAKSSKSSKYFVLHCGDFVKHLDNLEIEGGKYVVSANYYDIPTSKAVYVGNEPGKYHVNLTKYGVIEQTHMSVKGIEVISSVPDTSVFMCHLVLYDHVDGVKSVTKLQIKLDQELIFKEIQVAKNKDTAHVCFLAKKGQAVKIICNTGLQSGQSKMELYSYVSGCKSIHLKTNYGIAWTELTRKIDFIPTVKFNLIDVTEISEYNDQTAETAVASFFLGLGLVGFSAIIVLVAIIATKSSCPYVYVENEKGSRYFAGEIFSGAFYPKLERRDVMALPALKYNDSMKVIIANELKEKQFINEIKCIEVTHQQGSEILPDYEGNLYEVRNELMPEKVYSDEGKDLLNIVSANDSVSWNFSDHPGFDSDIKSAEMHFSNTDNKKKAALILNIRNSLIMDHAYYKFTELSGTSYEKFIALQKLKSKKELMAWAENQSIPLTVYVLTAEKEWKEVAKVGIVGPLAYRKLLVPLDLSVCSGIQPVIKVSSGAMFWELDKVSLSYDVQIATKNTELPLIYALDNSHSDVISYIKSDDKKYVVQNEIGEKIYLCYKTTPASPGFIKSYFLSAKGYYEHIRQFEIEPDLEHLKKFKQKNYFPKFIKEVYNNLNKQNYYLSYN